MTLLVPQHADRVHRDARDESANVSFPRLAQLGTCLFSLQPLYTRRKMLRAASVFLRSSYVMYASTDFRVFLKLNEARSITLSCGGED